MVTEAIQQTPQMDVYSYGILLCEVLTCRFPERGRFRAMLEQVTTLHRFGVTCKDLIISCVNEDPHKRPTMKQIIEQIDRMKQ